MKTPFREPCPSLPPTVIMRQMTLVKQSEMRMILMIAIAGLGACADFPQLDDRLDDAALAADYPTLLPLDPLLARAANQTTAITSASEANFDSRIATLRARAIQLRGPVIDAATRARMRRGVAIPAAIR